MLRVGRQRSAAKDLPLGVYPVKGRYYVRPVNEEMRRVFAVAFPGKKSAPLGADKSEMRKQWVKLFVTEVPPDDAASGTVGELVERYERDVLPDLDAKTKTEQTRYCRNIKAYFGARRYAKSEAEASTGPFVRSMDVTRYLRDEAKRKVYSKDGKRLISEGRTVAANKEIKCLSRIFRLAKTEWGYTEYNPCLQIEYNPESPRSDYQTDEAFMRVYGKASPVLQCMMDLAQMHGARRGMLMKATLASQTTEGLLLPLNKKKKTEIQRYQIIEWDDNLRAVIARALELRAKVRGGQKDVLDAATAPLFLTRRGKAYTPNSFNAMWQRARKAAGFKKHEFHFHDIRAKSGSDSPSEADAQNRLGHTDARTTRAVYRRKPSRVIPLPRVSGKKA